jgi:gas vesicle protein
MNEVETRRERSGFGMLLAFLGGAVVGGAVAMLFAPKSGPEIRRKIAEMAEQGKEKAERVPVAVREARHAAATAFTEALKQPS